MTTITRQAMTASAMFGGSIRSAREALGLTQVSCARSMSVTKNCLASLERGTDTRMSTALLALAMLGAAMAAMREGIGLNEAQLAEQAGLAPPIVKAIEAGMCLDMMAVVTLAQTYKGLTSAASVASLRRSTAA